MKGVTNATKGPADVVQNTSKVQILDTDLQVATDSQPGIMSAADHATLSTTATRTATTEGRVDTLEGEMDAVKASVSNAATKSEVSSVSSSVSSLQSKVNSAFTSAEYDDSTQMLSLTSANGTSSVGPIGGGSSGGKTFTPTTQYFKNNNMTGVVNCLKNLSVGTLCSIYIMPKTSSSGVGGTLTGILKSKSSSEFEFYYIGGTVLNSNIASWAFGALNYTAPTVFYISGSKLTFYQASTSGITDITKNLSTSTILGICITSFS